MNLEPEEPPFGPWRTTPVESLLSGVIERSQWAPGRPLIVAIDGRSASGKSTLAEAMAAAQDRTVIVHTDDLAWHEPLFDWMHLLRDNILKPLHDGHAISFKPPQCNASGRAGTIDVPSGTEVVIVEGVGAAHASVAELLDAAIWIQSDRREARTRGLARDFASGENGDRDETIAFWNEWGAAERTHLAADRPWERADIHVTGTPPFAVRPGQVATAWPRSS